MGVLFYRNNQPLKLKSTPVNIRIIRYIFSFLFIMPGLVFTLASQSFNTKEIDFHVENEKLSNVLLRLGNETNLNFSYDAGDSVFRKRVNYSTTNKQPLIILDELLSNSGCGFKLVGNQIVVFPSLEMTVLPVSVPEQLANNIQLSNESTQKSKTTEKPGVLIVTDTVFVRDTIIKFQTDTVFVIDTIIVEKEKPIKASINKLKDIPVDYFNKESSREKGWSGTIYLAPIISDFSLVRPESNLSIRNFSLGIEISKIFNNWNLTAGLKITQFGEKFNHSYSIQEGGFFVTDTIDTYYTVVAFDTTYYYVTDSSWKPINNQEYNYNINNRIGLLEVMASVSYDFYSNQSIRLYVKGGAQLGTMIYKNGLAIPDNNKPSGVDFADLSFRTQSISVLAGIGMKYRINSKLDFNSELFYLRYLDNIVIDYPKNSQIDGVGLKLGIIYYF